MPAHRKADSGIAGSRHAPWLQLSLYNMLHSWLYVT